MSSKQEIDYTKYPYKKTIPAKPYSSETFNAFFSNWRDPAGGSPGEIVNKIGGLGVHGAIVGAFPGAVQVFINENYTARYVTFYMAKNMIPLAGAGMIYAVGVHNLANIREKDDLINHGFGGVLAGIPLGGMLKSVQAGLAFSVVFAVAGMWAKHAMNNGWLSFHPPPPHQREMSFRINHWKSKNRPHEEGIQNMDD